MHSRAQHPHHLPWRLCGRQRSQDSLWKPGSTPPPPSCQQPRGKLMKQLGVVVFLPGVPVLHCCPGKPREYQASLRTSFLCSHLRLLPTEGVSPPGHWHITASISQHSQSCPKTCKFLGGRVLAKNKNNLVETAICFPNIYFSFMFVTEPGFYQTAVRCHFPASLAAKCDRAGKFWPMKCIQSADLRGGPAGT